MAFPIALRLVSARVVSALGVVSWKLRRCSTNDFVILMYHRIISCDEVREGVQAGMYVEPDTFERHLRFLKKYFLIVPISAILSNYEKVPNTLHAKPRCVFTFDDGWYDFFKYVFPILKTYQVPATVFLPTDFIGTANWLWTDRLAYLLFQRDKLKNLAVPSQPSTNSFIKRVEKVNDLIEDRIENAIEILKALHNDEIEEILFELSSRWNLNPILPGRAFLNWKEVREMGRSGLITYGSHTVTHRILTTLTDVEIQEELTQSKETLINERAVDPAFIPFCYPNGNHNERIAQMVKAAGYNLAVTTVNGWNNPKFNPFTLRRICIHQDMTSTEAMFGCRVVNLL